MEWRSMRIMNLNKLDYLMDFTRFWAVALILIGAVGLVGCSQVFATESIPGLPPETSIALTVVAFPLPTLPPPTFAPATVAPTYPPLPTYTSVPTYTPLPTYTPYPTYTPQPTVTPVPQIAPQIVYPTVPFYDTSLNDYSEHPFVLRVRNQNAKLTLWIGTSMPYGGNFIKPLHYVEFYPPQPEWMRIWWCRRGSFSADWDDQWWHHWEMYWDDRNEYFCDFKEVYVDESFQEFGVK